MKLAIVGATGLVGQTIIKVLEENRIKVSELIPVASSSSIGKNICFNQKHYSILGIEDAIKQKPDIVIFSAGKNVSLNYAEAFANEGTYVIDNSSAWRMHENIKLIVPEVNIDELTKEDKIIANPNCSTIQLVVVLNPLHKAYGIKRLVISTYQSVSGSGYAGINQLLSERKGETSESPAYPHKIDLNCIPHGGAFLENGYTEEEMKLIHETRKILSLPNLNVTSTVVRVPVIGGHSESVNIEFNSKFDISDISKILKNAEGVVVFDSPEKNIYPMPILAQDKNETFVGRIRIDESCENAINLWITADNLRKGAATNAVQIAEYLYKNII